MGNYSQENDRLLRPLFAILYLMLNLMGVGVFSRRRHEWKTFQYQATNKLLRLPASAKDVPTKTTSQKQQCQDKQGGSIPAI